MVQLGASNVTSSTLEQPSGTLPTIATLADYRREVQFSFQPGFLQLIGEVGITFQEVMPSASVPAWESAENRHTLKGNPKLACLKGFFLIGL